MAQAIRYVCGGCGHRTEAWSDGNPYYIDETGRKQYATPIIPTKSRFRGALVTTHHIFAWDVVMIYDGLASYDQFVSQAWEIRTGRYL